MTDLFDSARPMDAQRTLDLYQRFYDENGPNLPAGQPSDMHFVEALSQHLDGLDGLILDSYGVIGLGAQPIPGIVDLFTAAKARDMGVVILTNGASRPAHHRVQGYRDWGLPVLADDILSSRDACYQMVQTILAQQPEARFSYLDSAVHPFDDVPGALYHDEGDLWDRADYFIFLGATSWDSDHQNRLETALTKTGATIVIGNPDVSAPLGGNFTFEPGFWGMKAHYHTGAPLQMAGKPYQPAYEIAFAALEQKMGRPLERQKVAMVGDSLHTDILGAKSFGLTAILLSHYGLLAGRDIVQEAHKAGIFPDLVARHLTTMSD